MTTTLISDPRSYIRLPEYDRVFLNDMTRLLFSANASPTHERQDSTFGKLADLLVEAIARSIFTATHSCQHSVDEMVAYSVACDQIARRIYEEVLDNNESFTYNLDLWNAGTINL